MNSKGKMILTLLLCCMAGGVAFVVTQRLGGEGLEGSAPYGLRNWFHLTTEQEEAIQKADPTFGQEVSSQVRQLCSEQQKLAFLFDDAASENETIQLQVKRVITAHHALIRRIGVHLLAIRRTLSAEQQKQLMQLCAEVVRGREGQHLLCQCDKSGCPCKCCQQEEKGCQGCPSSSVCSDRRDRCKGCRRGTFSQEVELSPEQEKQIEKIDPDFAGESAILAEEVKRAHGDLAREMESMGSSDEQILQRLETVAEAHDRLEQRTIQHVLSIRSCLTARQQKRIAGLCAP